MMNFVEYLGLGCVRDIVKNENITFMISIPGTLHYFLVEQNWRIYYQLEVCSLII